MSYAARVTDPPTSHAAQDRIVGVSDLQGNILTVLSLQGPCTDERLVEEVGACGFLWDWVPRSPQRIRTARKELTDQGRVVDSGKPGMTKAGYTCKIWKVA